jgi:hypothetical protein
MALDLSQYETVKERKVKFYELNKDGRIIVENVTPNDQLTEFSLFKATLFKNQEEQGMNLPWSTGYAMEIRDKELKKTQYGKEYESVNFSSWTENCEESAVGRALDNAGFSNKKCSREEIEKTERMSNTIKAELTSKQPPVATIALKTIVDSPNLELSNTDDYKDQLKKAVIKHAQLEKRFLTTGKLILDYINEKTLGEFKSSDEITNDVAKELLTIFK